MSKDTWILFALLKTIPLNISRQDIFEATYFLMLIIQRKMLFLSPLKCFIHPKYHIHLKCCIHPKYFIHPKCCIHPKHCIRPKCCIHPKNSQLLISFFLKIFRLTNSHALIKYYYFKFSALHKRGLFVIDEWILKRKGLENLNISVNMKSKK